MKAICIKADPFAILEIGKTYEVHEKGCFYVVEEKRFTMSREVFEEMFTTELNGTIPRCRTCIHRKRYALNEYSSKVVQCCELQRSRRSNSGYKTIKVTDVACGMYKRE